ncbi:MAG: NAD-dependent epimerase [Proteobacteria bacterium]|nr:NAD-dependent epimerase [Pseudomonadota bacterium]
MTNHADWAARLESDRPVLVTGAAGFIGFFLAEKLLRAGLKVVGIDNLNPYYDPKLKQARLDLLSQYPGFAFEKLDLADRAGLGALFDRHGFRHVVNLAAQAGVRHSIENPHAYLEANLTGFLNILEECRRARVAHLVYASSSSVYGGNRKLPFSVHDSVDHPVSFYAATKKAGELMAHSYSHLYGVPATGLRFFTVYGPWGRPDMAIFIFTRALLAGEPIKVFNHGEMERDFTYVDDIVEGVARLLPMAPAPDPDFDTLSPDPGTSWAPHRIFNIGNSRPEKLMEMIAILEELTGREAAKEFLDMQPGDVPATYADVADLETAVGFRPATPLREGLTRFVNWYRDYYRV